MRKTSTHWSETKAFPFGLRLTMTRRKHVAACAPFALCLLAACPEAQPPDEPFDGSADTGSMVDGSPDAFVFDASANDLAVSDVSGSDAASPGDATRMPPVRIGTAQAQTHACGAAFDGEGNVYLAGYTNGALPGASAEGRQDMFLAKTRIGGPVQWIHQIGGGGAEGAIYTHGCAVAVGARGEAYVAGSIRGSGQFGGAPLPAPQVGFVARVNGDGSRAWLRSFGEGPGATKATHVKLYNGRVEVLGETDSAFVGQAPRGQTDVILTAFATETGAMGRSLRFGGAADDLAIGLVADAAGLWLGWRHSAGSPPTFGHDLVRLDAEDQIVVRYVAPPAAGFSSNLFSITNQGRPVVIGSVVSGDDGAYALRVHQPDGSLGPIVASRAAPNLIFRDFACGPTSCAVAGQKSQAPHSSGSGTEAFIDEYAADWSSMSRVSLVGDEPGRYTNASALVSATACRWYTTGWTTATLHGNGRIGEIDGYGMCADGRGVVTRSP